MSYSCDFASAIQACIVDLETALVSEKDQGRSQVSQSAVAGLNSTQTPAQTATNSSVSSTHNHAKIAETRIKEVLRESYRLVSLLGVF